mmetsp:Transcript_33935/g.97061  ORF Transcript_33935/g.97061 Transcript_33935/m.97061 type:complete len:300 (+) Transcript_33935:578-1477(+)
MQHVLGEVSDGVGVGPREERQLVEEGVVELLPVGFGGLPRLPVADHVKPQLAHERHVVFLEVHRDQHLHVAVVDLRAAMASHLQHVKVLHGALHPRLEQVPAREDDREACEVEHVLTRLGPVGRAVEHVRLHLRGGLRLHPRVVGEEGHGEEGGLRVCLSGGPVGPAAGGQAQHGLHQALLGQLGLGQQQLQVGVHLPDRVQLVHRLEGVGLRHEVLLDAPPGDRGRGRLEGGVGGRIGARGLLEQIPQRAGVRGRRREALGPQLDGGEHGGKRRISGALRPLGLRGALLAGLQPELLH